MINVDQMLNDYSYGPASTHLRKAVEWLSENTSDVDMSEFKSPDFLGMPRDLSKKLSHHDVDFIQLCGNDYTISDSPAP